MRDRTLKCGLVVLGVLALLLPACSTGGGKLPDNVSVPKTRPGEPFLGGDLEVESIEGPLADRTMKFTLANVSGKPLEDLTARVLFYLPPTGVQAYDTDPVEQGFSVFAGEKVPITVKPVQEGDILGWKLLVQPAVTVSREGGARGSTFLEGNLECVRIVDRLTALEPSLSFEILNVSADAQELLEYQVILSKEGAGSWSSGWQPIPGSIAAGATVTLSPDVSGSDVTGVASILLKIQRSVL